MLNIPADPSELINRTLTDLARALPESANPFLEESWMGAQGIANARRTFEFYIQLAILEKEAIPITAVELLPLWASYWGIIRNPATQASGNIVITGSAGSTVPAATDYQSSDGNSYLTANEITISETVIALTPGDLTSVGNLAICKLPSDQSLFSGLEVTVANADQTEYNGTFPITVIGADEFTFEMLSAPGVSPATGSITVTYTAGAVGVQSTGFGQSQNLQANEALNLASPIVGIDNQAFVDFNAVGGGTDEESDADLRDRLLDRVQNPVANFNDAAIEFEARKVPGVTDVWVFDITPEVGQVTIYFVRGNDENPIPDGSEVQTVKDQILTIKPANTADADVIVLAPDPVPATFTFSALTPNNEAVRNAISASLEALFADSANVSEALTEEQYNAAIVNAGATSFTLSSPVGDIGGGFGEYPTFNGVNFP